MNESELKQVAKISKHISSVRDMMQYVIAELQQRSLVHDNSKYELEELRGYMRFADMPEGLKYESDEYKEAMAKVMDGNDCFERHSQANDHHPEYYEKILDMGLFALIEMVCDWAGAHVAYGNSGGWEESVLHNVSRYGFTDYQKWVIGQTSNYLRDMVGLQ